jgi:hypothetical protein
MMWLNYVNRLQMTLGTQRSLRPFVDGSIATIYSQPPKNTELKDPTVYSAVLRKR